VEERGYVESPVRINAILEELAKTTLFHRVTPRRYSENHVREVHGYEFIEYLKNVCQKLKDSDAVYPYVFPIRNRTRPPKDLPLRAGYYCIDTFTPLTGNAYLAARRGVDCAITAAMQVLEGYRIAYALIRPPGHHAESAAYGGFCYFNSAAVAANLLSKYGKVAMLDIDYHHGNGQQEIFYDRADVLTISLHGHPSIAYPYFTGFVGEKGTKEGKGFNINIPLPEMLDGEGYRKALKEAIKKVVRFHPRYLVIPFGLDTAKEDPTGSWTLEMADFEAIGKMLGVLRLPTLVVQEGGYDTRVLGSNARAFFTGLWDGMYQK
jgi:acetoin utilization deacetylase AcuC-like enzyme